MIKIIIISIFILLYGCNNDKPLSSLKNNQNDQKIAIPEFNSDSAFSFVATQVSFGPRIPNSQNHKQCKQYLINKFKSYNFNIIEQNFKAKTYNGTILDATNIIATINEKANIRIMLAAHWDTRPYADQETNPELQNKPIDGANDGASGVGILIELARLLSKEKIDIGIDIILFDAEDYGAPAFEKSIEVNDDWCLGSQYWSKNLHIPGYSPNYGILLDMTGGRNAKFAKEEYSLKYASDIVEKIWTIAMNNGFDNYFIDKKVGAIIDDHYYVNTIAKIPCVNIVNYDEMSGNFFGNFWHTHKDNMSIIDKGTLYAVGQTLLNVIYSETNNNP